MAKKSAIRVALDLETTGLHPDDAILEVAAIKFRGTEVLDTFESFVAPGRPIPYRVQRLTGIKPEHLVGAPTFSSLSRSLQNFIGDYPIVGHSIPFDVGFLQRRGLARSNPLIDTFELATVLLPSLASYNLGQVATSLGVHVPEDRHRAMVDTVLAMEVFQVLYERIESVDLAMLNDLAHLDAPRTWPLLHFFRQELRERQDRDGLRGGLGRGSLGDRFAAQLGMDPRVLSFAVAKRSTNELTTPTVHTLSSQEHSAEDEPVELSHFTGYQSARAAVRKALDQKTSLLLEVTVGGQNYTPVLMPALEWLLEAPETEPSPRRLVIACANQQSARRLMETVLPRLQKQLQSQLPVAYLAERGGYLCTHRWFGAALRRTSGELTAEQARGLAKLGLWAQQTLYGERNELTLLQQEMAAWDRVSSGVERLPSTGAGSMYERCTYRRKGYCFVSLAEERVNAARIVITTHGALFDDLSQPSSLLAHIPHRLFLDADLLEEDNARWSSAEVDQQQLLRILNTLGTELANGRYQGLLALAAPALRENGPGGCSTAPTIAKSELDARLLNWFQALRQARSACEGLFHSFSQLVEEYVQQSGGRDKGRKGGRGQEQRADQPLRLTGQMRQVPAWGETEQAWKQANQRLQTVIDLAHEAEKVILSGQRKRRQPLDGGEESSVASELIVVAHQLEEQMNLLQQAITLNENERVYWLRMPPQPASLQHQTPAQRNNAAENLPPTQPPEVTPVLYSQLVQISTVLKEFVLKEQCSTIFAGTALSVDNTFSFMRGRLGLEQDSSLTAAIVTEHQEQTLLYLPNDLPEPNAPQYQRNVDEALIQLATSLDGQVVALFTSHAALRSSYSAIKPLLETRGILVLGQGVDGSPRQLWQVFQSQEKVVLLGTGSFWDGVDEVTRPPTCLVVARLPMPVLNDPPVAARAEQYSDQLHNLTVPMASLRMRRTLNRLVWGEQKRNVVVVLDRRLTSKEYGSVILQSLPTMTQKQGPVSHMAEQSMDWLTRQNETL
ncbi:exonuclease domain-containing protein [Tengunoibacter tsumagoiensis]|uniref:DNA polymerase III subunit epsilon n=1 Tax=Tengunoibacter tsumagoiensis TaxID=2014871 RepID=A0A401ZZM7_9CHLR|nr:exonuclease domain-containing protein [Tengunoibacter tsumagoiensis]GCE12315.1 DNA polymerase III subunit epsilon [Tengunoibacter tsumagoiensis]